MMHVLNETLTYEVDQIRIVEPQETDLLQIEDGQDLCTLVTCTPYGINTPVSYTHLTLPTTPYV